MSLCECGEFTSDLHIGTYHIFLLPYTYLLTLLYIELEHKQEMPYFDTNAHETHPYGGAIFT